LINGVSGVGKSTVADAIGRVLTSEGLTTAVIDTDALAQFGPPPRRDSRGFYNELKCVNLAAVWANFRAAGARFAVVSGGIDSIALRESYVRALAGCEVQVVRLVAPIETIRQRLAARDDSAAFEPHTNRLAEHLAALDAAAIEDFTVTSDRPVSEVAEDIVQLTGWLGPIGSSTT
jgi:predicted kinase